MEDAHKTFDWVKARAECSVEQLFMLLGEVIDADVKAIQGRQERSGNFKVSRPHATKIVVIKSAGFSESVQAGGVVFERTPTTIEVKRSTVNGIEPAFTAVPSLDGDGTCRLQVNEQPLELWQVSRKALEGLFFS